MQRAAIALCLIGAIVLGRPVPVRAAGCTIVGWNNLGMHCMDADFSLLCLLPPYNTIHAQVIDPSGKRVRELGRRRDHRDL